MANASLDITLDNVVYGPKFDNTDPKSWMEAIYHPDNTQYLQTDAELDSLCLDSSGNVYAFGSIRYDPSTSRPASTVVKIDTNGNILWQQGTVGALDEYGINTLRWNKLSTIDDLGRVYTLDSGIYPYTPNNIQILTKINADSTVLWQIFDGVYLSYLGNLAENISVDSNHNIYITQSRGAVSLMKYDSNGSRVWLKDLVGNDVWQSEFSMCRHTTANTIYSAVTYTNNGVIFCLYKLDGVANVDWVKFINLGYTSPYVTLTDTNDNIYIVTYMYEYMYDPSRISVIKYNIDGVLQYSKVLTVPNCVPSSYSYDMFKWVTMDPSGNIYCILRYVMGDPNNPDNGYLSDALIIKLDPDANVIWQNILYNRSTNYYSRLHEPDVPSGIVADNDYVTIKFNPVDWSTSAPRTTAFFKAPADGTGYGNYDFNVPITVGGNSLYHLSVGYGRFETYPYKDSIIGPPSNFVPDEVGPFDITFADTQQLIYDAEYLTPIPVATNLQTQSQAPNIDVKVESSGSLSVVLEDVTYLPKALYEHIEIDPNHWFTFIKYARDWRITNPSINSNNICFTFPYGNGEGYDNIVLGLNQTGGTNYTLKIQPNLYVVNTQILDSVGNAYVVNQDSIAKIGPNGSLLWQTFSMGLSDDEYNRNQLAIDSSDHLYTHNYGSASEFYLNTKAGFVKYNHDGSINQNIQLQFDDYNTVSQTSTFVVDNNDCIIWLTLIHSIEMGDYRYQLTKIDPSINNANQVVWSVSISFPDVYFANYDNTGFLNIDANNNIYFVALADSNLGVGIVVGKYNTDGIVQYLKFVPRDYDSQQRITGVAVDASGGIYISTVQSVTGGDGLHANANIVKLDTDGNIVWQNYMMFNTNAGPNTRSLSINGDSLLVCYIISGYDYNNYYVIAKIPTDGQKTSPHSYIYYDPGNYGWDVLPDGTYVPLTLGVTYTSQEFVESIPNEYNIPKLPPPFTTVVPLTTNIDNYTVSVTAVEINYSKSYTPVTLVPPGYPI